MLAYGFVEMSDNVHSYRCEWAGHVLLGPWYLLGYSSARDGVLYPGTSFWVL